MNKLFARTLVAILSALVILIVLLSALTVAGLRRSIAEWDTTRTRQLETIAVEILHNTTTTASVPENLPLFVYDSSGELVFSNRPGTGRASAQGEMIPLRFNGRLIGYYQSGQLRFRSDQANKRFLASLQRSLILGLLLSLAVAVVTALLFSYGLSAPAVRLAARLDRMSRGDLASNVEQKGPREIAMIGRSADRLRLQLLREQEQRRQWVHDIAHDLRTPIAAIGAQFEGMRDGALPTTHERMDRLLGEIARLQHLVVDLEELMRLESPEMTLAIETVDPVPLVKETTDRFEAAAQVKDVQLNVHLGQGSILVDPQLFRRALSNLMSNALRHCIQGGVVSLTITRKPKAVTIAIENTGDPIPEGDLGRVFDRLYRGDSARTSEGSGLGLTIVRNIVELHGGRAEMRNQPDGVVVELNLPQP